MHMIFPSMAMSGAPPPMVGDPNLGSARAPVQRLLGPGAISRSQSPPLMRMGSFTAAPAPGSFTAAPGSLNALISPRLGSPAQPSRLLQSPAGLIPRSIVVPMSGRPVAASKETQAKPTSPETTTPPPDTPEEPADCLESAVKDHQSLVDELSTAWRRYRETERGMKMCEAERGDLESELAELEHTGKILASELEGTVPTEKHELMVQQLSHDYLALVVMQEQKVNTARRQYQLAHQAEISDLENQLADKQRRLADFQGLQEELALMQQQVSHEKKKGIFLESRIEDQNRIWPRLDEKQAQLDHQLGISKEFKEAYHDAQKQLESLRLENSVLRQALTAKHSPGAGVLVTMEPELPSTSDLGPRGATSSTLKISTYNGDCNGDVPSATNEASGAPGSSEAVVSSPSKTTFEGARRKDQPPGSLVIGDALQAVLDRVGVDVSPSQLSPPMSTRSILRPTSPSPPQPAPRAVIMPQSSQSSFSILPASNSFGRLPTASLRQPLQQSALPVAAPQSFMLPQFGTNSVMPMTMSLPPTAPPTPTASAGYATFQQ